MRRTPTCPASSASRSPRTAPRWRSCAAWTSRPGSCAIGRRETSAGPARGPAREAADARWRAAGSAATRMSTSWRPRPPSSRPGPKGVNVVHLLATQWGDHHTSTTDLGGDLLDDDGRHAVWVGSENRQNMLGHVGIVGTRRPVLPVRQRWPAGGSHRASRDPPRGRLAGAPAASRAAWPSGPTSRCPWPRSPPTSMPGCSTRSSCSASTRRS